MMKGRRERGRGRLGKEDEEEDDEEAKEEAAAVGNQGRRRGCMVGPAMVKTNECADADARGRKRRTTARVSTRDEPNRNHH